MDLELLNTGSQRHYVEERLKTAQTYKGQNRFADAAEVYEQAGSAGYRPGYMLAGDAHNINGNHVAARRDYTMGALSGCKDAMFGLGVMYYEGLGGDTDHILARHCFKESGTRNAKYYLSVMMVNGQGGPADIKGALPILEELSQSSTGMGPGRNPGHLKAQLVLGQIYQWGIGVTAQPERAFKLFGQAVAEHGRQAESLIREMRETASASSSARLGEAVGARKKMSSPSQTIVLA